MDAEVKWAECWKAIVVDPTEGGSVEEAVLYAKANGGVDVKAEPYKGHFIVSYRVEEKGTTH